MKKAFVVMTLGLLTVACTGEQVTATLEAAVDAAIAVAPVIEATSGVSPGVQAIIGTYLTAAQGCMGHAVTVLGSGGLTPADQGAQIASACATSATVTLPLGTPQNVAVAVTAVASAITNFIQATHAPVPMPPLAHSFFETKGAAKKHLDQKRLARIRRKLEKIQAGKGAQNPK